MMNLECERTKIAVEKGFFPDSRSEIVEFSDLFL